MKLYRSQKSPEKQPKSMVAAMAADWKQRWIDVFRGKIPGDMLAGVTVAAVALPLNVGLAVACGLPPVAGLIAGALGGALAILFGSAPLLVTGPAAALSVMVLDIQKTHGSTGVALAALLVGVSQLIMAFGGAGRLIAKVPESVLAGFTTGVGIKLLDQQIPEFLGFPDVLDAAGASTGKPIFKMADIALMMHQPKWLHHVSLFSVVCGLFVAFLVVTFAKYKRVPAAILGIAIITFVSTYLNWDIERVGAIPNTFPAPSMPLIADEEWLDLLTKVAPLALLAAVESLLTARVIDRMVPEQKPHNSNLELFGQGLANIGVGFFFRHAGYGSHCSLERQRAGRSANQTIQLRARGASFSKCALPRALHRHDPDCSIGRPLVRGWLPIDRGSHPRRTREKREDRSARLRGNRDRNGDGPPDDGDRGGAPFALWASLPSSSRRSGEVAVGLGESARGSRGAKARTGRSASPFAHGDGAKVSELAFAHS